MAESQIRLALSLVDEYHAGQMFDNVSYKQGHLLPVARLAIARGYDDELTVAACLLHDIVEDTDMMLDGLRSAGLHEEVVHTVDIVTHAEGEDRTIYIPKIFSHPRAVVVKFHDSLRSTITNRRLGPTHPQYGERFPRYYRNLLDLAPHMPTPQALREMGGCAASHLMLKAS